MVALALCAVLMVSALAAGSSIWQSISARQGPFSQIAQTIHGAVCTDQGIEVQVLSALADDVRGQVYFTVRDVTGNRLDRQLTLKPTADSDIGGNLVEYDPESRTALFVAHLNYYDPQIHGAVGIITGRKEQCGGTTRLSLDGMTTRTGQLEASASCAGVTDQLLNSLPLSDEDRVVLRVADTGVGIPEEDLPKIFDRFYRVDKARSRAAGGTGLGLSIVRDTVRQHGGAITVARREPEGTVFTVLFPHCREVPV